MWREGSIGVPGSEGGIVSVRYQVKVYDEGSVFGINGGRISKLWLSIDGREVANYDRGWDVRPTRKEAEIALAILLDEFK